VRVAGPSATLLVENREVEAPIAPRLPGGPLVVGDRVDVREAGGDLVVTGIRPRVTHLERVTGPSGRPRPRTVVANADLLLVVAAVMDPPLRTWVVDRYMVAAHAGGLAVVRARFRRHSQTPSICPAKTAPAKRPSRIVVGVVTRDSAP